MASHASVSDAHRHLSRDPVMRRLIRHHGPCARAPRRWSPYEALTRAIAHQQLNGRAAETILTRFVALFENGRFPSPADVSAARVARLRRAGFSRGKVRAIKDIARHALAGVVPTRRVAARLDDEVIIEQLTRIHGVGRWTVEMLLIFTLGRPDIFPVDDFGVREGYRVLHGLPGQPRPKELAALAAIYAPFRSTAAWYLWRAADADRAARAAAKTATAAAAPSARTG